LSGIDRSLSAERRINLAVEANVRHSVKLLERIPEGREAIEQGQVRLVPAVYELASGIVRFLDG
jgi:carbonic anhydrase